LGLQDNDPLGAFARQRIAASGGPLSAQDARERERDARRRSVRVTRVVVAVVGVLLLGAALAALGASLLGVGPLGGGQGLFLALALVVGAAYPLYLSRILRIPWHLAEKGRSTEAEGIVLRVGRGTVVQGFRTYWTIHRARLAVQVPGGTPYEVVTTVLGWVNVGERLRVFVDSANPKDVLVSRD
jgi:hypothetical protein